MRVENIHIGVVKYGRIVMLMIFWPPEAFRREAWWGADKDCHGEYFAIFQVMSE